MKYGDVVRWKPPVKWSLRNDRMMVIGPAVRFRDDAAVELVMLKPSHNPETFSKIKSILEVVE